MNDAIIKAIKDGEDMLVAKLAQEAKVKAIQVAEDNTYRLKLAAEAKVWANDALPDLIKSQTAIGKRALDLGSCDSDEINISYYKSQECEKLGMKVGRVSYRADPGSDGAYAHGNGVSFTLTW